MTPTLQQYRANFGEGRGNNRQGFCNNPHPSPKHRETVKVPVLDGNGKQIQDEYGQVIFQDKVRATVVCNRFGDHPGDCSAFAFSISVPDVWPNTTPVDLDSAAS